MPDFEEKDLFRLAKRHHNTKRTYLLVDHLQGKHMPVSPAACLTMLHTLGDKLREKYPGPTLVVGFAETATAVGAAVAECFGRDCFYIHTTREDLEGVGEWIIFEEEHSHATEQKMAAAPFEENLSGVENVIFVDDEISTGKTLMNMMEKLRVRFPGLEGKKIVAASVINRLSDENEGLMNSAGIICESLLRLENIDYSESVAPIEIDEPRELEFTALEDYEERERSRNGFFVYLDGISRRKCPEMQRGFRTGMRIGDYLDKLFDFYPDYAIAPEYVKPTLGADLLVLGTEECMYAGLKIAEKLENSGLFKKVSFHATTRSPIGVSSEKGYPITVGYKLPSLYDGGRTTFVYDLKKYDGVLIVTDAEELDMKNAEYLAGVLKYAGVRKRVEMVVI
ncbi:MAG: phosphoribosyltransferase domain-containing protein [Ruminococcus sp.]|nr:phosphoribosyltransferase domain-containing protein [Ruminococcus sp.]